MTANVIDLPQPPIPSIVGPPLSGSRVIVDGRVIPRLHCHDQGDHIEIILDHRWSLTVSRDDAIPVAAMIAHALAIGEGYMHLAADAPGGPFAPRYMRIDGSSDE